MKKLTRPHPTPTPTQGHILYNTKSHGTSKLKKYIKKKQNDGRSGALPLSTDGIHGYDIMDSDSGKYNTLGYCLGLFGAFLWGYFAGHRL